jgi:hypothetical protein
LRLCVLCLSATADFWLNDAQGLPLMVWTGELSEKLQSMQIQSKQNIVDQLLLKRKNIPAKVKLSEMTEQERITKLKPERDYFMSTLKMICYRAETAVVNLLYDIYGRLIEGKRMLIKSIIYTPTDFIPDHIKNTLTIKWHALNTPKVNKLVNKLCKELNESETVYPGTNLKLIYKTVLR